MKVDRLWVATAVAAGGLVAAIVITAGSSADGAPRGNVLTRAATAAPAPDAPVRLDGCTPAGGGGASSVRLDGTCSGLVTGGFACVRAGEIQTLSIRRPLPGGRSFYLTIVIPEFEGAGDYSDDEVTAQLIGPRNTPRWSSRGSRIAIRLTRDGTFELGDGVLLPEPGTPASGVINIRGRAVCR